MKYNTMYNTGNEYHSNKLVTLFHLNLVPACELRATQVHWTIYQTFQMTVLNWWKYIYSQTYDDVCLLTFQINI